MLPTAHGPGDPYTVNVAVASPAHVASVSQRSMRKLCPATFHSTTVRDDVKLVATQSAESTRTYSKSSASALRGGTAGAELGACVLGAALGATEGGMVEFVVVGAAVGSLVGLPVGSAVGTEPSMHVPLEVTRKRASLTHVALGSNMVVIRPADTIREPSPT